MPIKFPCPHCQKVLSVKDHLAGKKGPCPSCKKILTVPLESTAALSAAAPTPPPATTPSNGHTSAKTPQPAEKPVEPAPPPEDAEAAAAAAFADEPPPVEETTNPAFVDFNCPQCDEPLHLSADLAGKRASCPECKRIIKVPEIKKVEKADWRKTNAAGLPSGARRPDEPVPEGAWGSTAAQTVSREALEEANVIPDKYSRPLTTQQKVTRWVLLAGAVCSFLVCAGVAFGWWMSWRSASSFEKVEEYANSPAATEKVGHEGVAALHIALGEYQLRAKQPDSAKEAQKHFGKAVETLASQAGATTKDGERDALLADLALLQTDLGGNKEDIDNKTRLKWDEAQRAIGQTLHAMQNSEARLDAYRAVCRRLLGKKETKHALALARQLSDLPKEKAEAVAVAGLEMLAANDRTGAEEAGRDALAPFTQKEKKQPVLPPSVVALVVALGQEIPPYEGEGKRLAEEEDNIAVGKAEGFARNRDWGKAREQLDNRDMNPVARLRAYTALTAVGDAKSDNPDLSEALKLATGELKQRGSVAWLQLRVAELAANAGVGDDQLNRLADAIQDSELAGHARLIVLRQKLAGKNAGSPTPLAAEPPTLSHYLSIELVARHNRSYSAAKTDNDAERAFGSIGAMIGSHSK